MPRLPRLFGEETTGRNGVFGSVHSTHFRPLFSSPKSQAHVDCPKSYLVEMLELGDKL